MVLITDVNQWPILMAIGVEFVTTFVPLIQQKKPYCIKWQDSGNVVPMKIAELI